MQEPACRFLPKERNRAGTLTQGSRDLSRTSPSLRTRVLSHAYSRERGESPRTQWCPQTTGSKEPPDLRIPSGTMTAGISIPGSVRHRHFLRSPMHGSEKAAPQPLCCCSSLSLPEVAARQVPCQLGHAASTCSIKGGGTGLCSNTHVAAAALLAR